MRKLTTSTPQTNPPEPEPTPNTPPAESSPGFAFASANRPRLNLSVATYVTIVKGTEDHPDAQASKILLDACRTSTGFKCLRCEFTTTKLESITYHLQDEINNVMLQLQNYYKSFGKPQPQPLRGSAHQITKPTETK